MVASGMRFQSTLSVRRATAGLVLVGEGRVISIPALRKESDFIAIDYVTGVAFQSTLSVRRAT